MFKTCQFLLCFHLSDNCINKDIQQFYNCVRTFGIDDEDLAQINRIPKQGEDDHPTKKPPSNDP